MIIKLCRENKCDSGVLNFVMGVLEEYSKYADTLINPENSEVFTNVKKRPSVSFAIISIKNIPGLTGLMVVGRICSRITS